MTLVANMNVGVIPRSIRLRVFPVFWRIYSKVKAPHSEYSVSGKTIRLHTATPAECKVITNTFNSERDVLIDFVNNLRPDDVFYDIGANVGQYSCLAGISGADVIAFDPHPRNTNRIRDNLDINGIDGKVVEAALSDTDGELGFDVSEDDAGADQGELDEYGQFTVKTYRGDTYVNQSISPSVLKIDVEGAEMSVLQGFGDGLHVLRLIYVERHFNKMDEDPDAILELLHDAGFETHTVADRGAQDMIRAE